MKRQYLENDIMAEFSALDFGENIPGPIKATIFLFKIGRTGRCVWSDVVYCFYDVYTQKVWIDERKSPLHTDVETVKNAICAFVKKTLDSIFYDAEGYEKHLVEILCQEECLLLGDSAYPITTTQYSLYQRCGGYELRVPMLNGGGATDELLSRVNKSILPWDLAFPLNWIVMADPSFLNRKYMLHREHGRRDGIVVVRGFQRRVQAILERAEECMKIVNEYRERIVAQRKKQPDDCN